MAKLTPPNSFDFTQPQRRGDWKKRFSRCRIASKLSQDDLEVQVSALIYCMGAEADTLFGQFSLSADYQEDYDKVLKAFDHNFTTKTNYIHYDAVFNRRVQEEKESIEEFVKSLYELASRCEFKTMKETNMRQIGSRSQGCSSFSRTTVEE